jgi:UDP-N-acetylmuramoyl-L-alanyl-D-glutamate--2,6-diaminopimelate ligase
MMTAISASHAWRLGDLVAGVVEPGSAGDRHVSALALDSRAVCRGALFLACQGDRTHGLAFAEEAARRGAVAILAETTADWPPEALGLIQARAGIPVLAVAQLSRRASALADRFYGEPSADLEVIGVTAPEDASSIAHLLAQAMAAEQRCGLISALGAGFPGDLRPADEAAPDALILQAMLADMRARGAGAVALELTPRAVADGRVAGVRFSHTLLGGPGATGRIDQVAREPQVIARGLQSGCPTPRWLVLNLDDPPRDRLFEGLGPEVRLAAFGLDPTATAPDWCDLWVLARGVEPHPGGLRIAIASSLGAGELDVGLIGTSNVSHLLAVLAVLLSRGLPLERALRELAAVRGVPGRMESFGGDGAPLVVVDDAHSPDALEKALTDLRLHGGRRVITVAGCGGDRERGERPLIGAIAERLSDALILTDDNPRGEDGDAIIAEILGGVSRPDKVRVERQRGLAIRLAIALAGTGDAVLVAGKGHETTQDLGELKVHFSDRAQVVEALREWREGHH